MNPEKFYDFSRVNSNMKSQKYLLDQQPNNGFSLLELLVVIAIMAILISIGFSSFATAQKKTRDSKRKSDVKEIQQALEQYYSVCGLNYPAAPGSYYTSINCAAPAISIMPAVPMDPRATPYYCPTPAADCTTSNYKVCANLEAETPNTFCVTNQQ